MSDLAEATLSHPSMSRCSSELVENTSAVVAWGRSRWPDARVLLELRVGGCRLDVAFVRPDRLIGVEIKSSRDTLSRLDTQLRHFCREVPEMWVAVAPKWLPKINEVPWSIGRVVVEGSELREGIEIRPGLLRPRHDAHLDEMLTAPMLHLLWRVEAVALCCQYGVRIPGRMPLYQIIRVLARRLTGDQIVTGVCAALRSRPVLHGADAPSPKDPPRR